MAIAVDRYWVYPTTDIHLVRGGPPMKLRLFNARTVYARNWQELTTVTGHTFTSASNGIVTVGSNGEFNPGATGTTTVRIQRPATSGLTTLRAIVRVSVHSEIDRIWTGNNQVTVRKAESNYILSVYARFTDGTVADITGHPYLRYLANPSLVVVDPDGRVSGRELTEGTPVYIDLQGLPDTLTPTTVEVTIIDPAEELAPGLLPIYGSKKLTDRRNILLVPEGASGSEMARFKTDIAEKIARRLFRSESHSPFHLLRDSFNLWLATQPSPERGITVGPPIRIRRSAGEPFQPGAAMTHVPSDLFPLQARDSHFGLIYGARLGDPEARTWSITGTPNDLRDWLQPARPCRSIGVDYRRVADPATDPVVSFRTQLDAFLDRLGPDAAHWKTNGKDAPLVCFLANDDLHGGAYLSDQEVAVATLGHGAFVLDSLSNPPLHPGRSFWDHEPRLSSQKPSIEHVTSKVSHELGHSPVFKLGDEYGVGRLQLGAPAPTHMTRELESCQNLHIGIAVGMGGDPPAINTGVIKWNRHRIASAGILESAPSKRSTGEIVVRLKKGWEGTWATGHEVFLRSVTPALPRSPPLKLREFEPDAREAILLPTGGRSPNAYYLPRFDSGSLMYAPKKGAGTFLSLIDAKVLADLRTNGAFGQLTIAQCSGTAPPPPDNPKEDMDATRYPRIRPSTASFWVSGYRIIGLYEGGGGFRCRVYRPSGQCRMRNSYDDIHNSIVGFCFVCQYSMVQNINPARHPTLDTKEYPE